MLARLDCQIFSNQIGGHQANYLEKPQKMSLYMV